MGTYFPFMYYHVLMIASIKLVERWRANRLSVDLVQILCEIKEFSIRTVRETAKEVPPLVAGPLKKLYFFAASLTCTSCYPVLLWDISA